MEQLLLLTPACFKRTEDYYYTTILLSGSAPPAVLAPAMLSTRPLCRQSGVVCVY